MRNNFIFIGILVAVCLAVWGIFSLIFPVVGTLMVLNAVSGMLMVIILLTNLLVNSSRSTLTVKNASTMMVLNLSGIALFVWSLLFTFLMGAYDNAERSLTVLYVGYLVIFVVAAIYFLMADRGGSVSQAINEETQATIEYKSAFLSKLNAAKARLLTLEPDARAEVHKKMSLCISKIQSIPAGRFNGQTVANSGLDNVILRVTATVETGGIDGLPGVLKELDYVLSTFK